jgi:hypothetical protein
MDNYSSNSKSILVNENVTDFVSNNILEEEAKIKKELFKKKLTIISLGTIYVLLLIVSFTLLS